MYSEDNIRLVLFFWHNNDIKLKVLFVYKMWFGAKLSSFLAISNFCRLLIIFEKPMNMYGRHSKFKERLAEMERQQHANFCR